MIWSLRHVHKWKETGDWGHQEGGVKVVKTIYAVLKSLTEMSWEKITNVFLYMASLNKNLIIIKIINF